MAMKQSICLLTIDAIRCKLSALLNMAIKDFSNGWGTLPSGMANWCCPKCSVSNPVASWDTAKKDVNGNSLDGRKCPSCGYVFATLGETDQILCSTQGTI